MTTNNETTHQLDDGRTLAYIDGGDREAPAILFFHGSGSSADGLGIADRIVRRPGRLVSPARPGMGLSDPDPDRTLAGWASDVAELADALGIGEFSVLGFSGGAAYAAATAHALPDRVTRAALLSRGGPFTIADSFDGMTRANRFIWFLARRQPSVLRFLFKMQAAQMQKDPAKATAAAIRALSDPDKAAILTLTEADRQRFFAEPMAEALHQGPAGLVQDMTILARPWGFEVRDIKVPVELWHGANDTTAPVTMARRLAEAIPDCTAHIVADAGHVSVIIDHIDDALDTLLPARGA